MSAAKKKKNNKKKKKNNNSNSKNNNQKIVVEKVSEEEKVVVDEPTIELNIVDKLLQEEQKKSEAEEVKKEEIKVEKKEEELKPEEKVEKEEKKESSVQIKDTKSKEEKNKSQDTIKELVEKKKKNDEKPDYVKAMLKNKKKRRIIIISAIIILLLVILFSTVFAIGNMGNSNIVKGISIKNIDVSKCSIDGAKNLITEITNDELLSEITLKFGENYKSTIKPEQIDFKYNIDKAVQDAYQIGRTDSIIKNNYEILGATLFNKNIELDYTYNENLLKDFIDNLSSEIPGVVVEPSFYIEEANLFIDKGTDGIEVEKEKLKDLIIESICKRTIAEVSKEGYVEEIEIPTREAKAEDIDIDKIYGEVFREPQNAYFETDPPKIFVDVDGIDFAISKEEAKTLISKESKDEYTIPLKISKAEITIKDLGKEAFPYMISSFSTKYDASNINRSTNLEIAARKINGTVVMPGETFSYNKVVGKRTIEEGYKDAKIYADGGVVDGLAGGICQISSTLYNAALLANLEIVERKNHSYPASYIQVGRDATVVYGVKDLQFKNTRTYPIKIESSVKNGVAEFKIYGIQEEEEYEIKILPVTTGTIPYGTSYVQDPSLAPGQQVVQQSGHMGYYVTTYIEKRLNGAEVSKEVLSKDTYSPMQTIIRTGPAVAPAPVPAPVDPNIPQ